MDKNEEKPLVISYNTEKRFYRVDCTKSVLYNKTLVFAEYYGYEENGNYISKQFKSRKTIDSMLRFNDSEVRTEANMKIQKCALPKNRFAYLATADIAFGSNPKVFVGNNLNKVKEVFSNWLLNNQPIPYPRQPELYQDKLGMLAEEYIFNEMIVKGLLESLTTTGDVVAYGLTNAYEPMSDAMKDIVLKCVKLSGLLEVDRIKTYLSKNAPDIGESVNNQAVVHTVISNSTDNITYYVIEYDRSTEEVFCLVNNNGSIEWEQFLFSKLFNEVNNFVSKKNEHKNIIIDNNGNITKNVSDVA